MPLGHRCQTCREARVKCDCHFPICRRCERLKLECVHVEEDDRFRHVRANPAVSRRQSSTPESSKAQPESSMVQPVLHSVTSPIDQKAEILANQAFLANFVLHPCNHEYSPGYFEALPILLAGWRSSVTLELSVSASALAFLSMKTGEPRLKEKAYQTYAKALTALKVDVQYAASSDSTLMALLVLDYFDIFLGHEKNSVGSHSQILGAIIKLRGVAQLYGSVGFSLFRVAFQKLLIRRMLFYDIDSQYDEEASLLDNLDPEPFYSRIAKQNFHVTSLYRRVCSKLTNDETSDIEDVLNEVSILQMQHKKLYMDCNPSQRPRSMYRPRDAPKPKHGVVGESIQVYHDMWLAHEWIAHRAFMLALLDKVAKLVTDAMEEGVGSARILTLSKNYTDLVTEVRKLSDAIIHSIPMLTGTVTESGIFYADPRGKTVGGFFALFPLQAIVQADHAGAEQVLRSRILLKTMENRMRGRVLLSEDMMPLLRDLTGHSPE